LLSLEPLENWSGAARMFERPAADMAKRARKPSPAADFSGRSKLCYEGGTSSTSIGLDKESRT